MHTKLITEFLGTALLLAIVTGSGIMGEALGAGNAAVALLGNSIATGCGLFVLITLLGPISGAHFNPVVSLLFWRAGQLETQKLLAYLAAQFTGAIAGVWLTHFIFGLPLLQASAKPRNGAGIWLSEFLSTLILLAVIRLGLKYANEKIALLIAMTVTAGYWFTSSTFFANPAVTIARSLTNTFVGIAPADILGFISAQLLACFIVILIVSKKNMSEHENISKQDCSTVIYHNPSCGTSRNTLAMIRASGVDPDVIEYLKTPPSRQKLVELIARMQARPRDVLRQKGTPYAELGLDDVSLSDDALIDAMLQHPILINRPIVVTAKGVKLCRPSELVLEILENPHIADFVKEDGEIINT